MEMKKIKLNIIEGTRISEESASQILGGDRSCGCACWYRNQGGASIEDNRDANYLGGPNGLKSPQTAAANKADMEDGVQYW